MKVFSTAPFAHRTMAALTFCALAAAGVTVIAQRTITEINPSQSTLHATDPDGAAGGRVNGLARAGATTTYYAAGEWSGLYRSTDAGRTWARLNAHIPVATWDVEVNPADLKKVYATSFYDGRIKSFAGINVSADAGATWTHPATATPSATFCTDAERREEPSAFGIAIDPTNAKNVYIGTNCGLAISNDAGTSWRFVDPTPTSPADDVWDVVVHQKGIIDVCGDDGHRRSVDGGANWTGATSPIDALPSGICSIAASPDEAHVLFAVSGTLIFETDDGGTTWVQRFRNPMAQGRIPFVATNQRAGAAFDLWFGDISLFRAGCTTPSPATPGGSARCPPSDTWAGPFTRDAGAHDDGGDIAFAPVGSSGADACPALYSSDGGVYFNTRAASPACHTPKWDQPKVTPKGLWLFGMSGADRAGAANEDIYFGTQDNGTFASRDAGASWKNSECCDGFDSSASQTAVLYTVCCFAPPANRLFLRGPGMTGGGFLSTPPPGTLPGFRPLDIVDRFGPDDYVVVSSEGVFVTPNINASTITWTELGASTTPPAACGVRVTGPAATPTFYVQAGFQGCSGRRPDQLFRYNGLGPGGTWQPVIPPGGAGGFGVIAVGPGNPQRLAASHLRVGSAPQMIFSGDGGATWTVDAALGQLMTGNGTFRAQTRRGPTDFTGFNGYPQPTLIAFDPSDVNTIVAGAADAGVFVSRDRGKSWAVVTNNSGDAANPIVPRPWFAYFDREGTTVDFYVGTQGRGIWRVREKAAPQPSPTPTQ